nr:hypothetical protein [Human alphaherpesvirus 2]
MSSTPACSAPSKMRMLAVDAVLAPASGAAEHSSAVVRSAMLCASTCSVSMAGPSTTTRPLWNMALTVLATRLAGCSGWAGSVTGSLGHSSPGAISGTTMFCSVAYTRSKRTPAVQQRPREKAGTST